MDVDAGGEWKTADSKLTRYALRFATLRLRINCRLNSYIMWSIMIAVCV